MNLGMNLGNTPAGGLAHVKGRSDSPLWSLTVPQVIKSAAKTWPNGEALVCRQQSVRWSWLELEERIDQLAASLRKLGLSKGDRVGIWSPNRVEWVLTQFATARLGLILVTINPAYRVGELEYALKKIGCKALFTATAFKTSDYLGMIQSLVPKLREGKGDDLRSERLPDLKILVQFGASNETGLISFEDLMKPITAEEKAQLDRITESLHPDDPINIQFTSGTTGAPKGATLTHNGIVNNSRFIVASQELDATDRLCIPVPLYHCFGMVAGTLGCAIVGATMVFPGEAFDPVTTLQALSEEKCTAVYGVPTMFIAMLECPERAVADLSNLRTGIMAGAPCPIEIMKRCISEMNLSDLTICYGMTETSPIAFQTSPSDSVEHRVKTVGRVHPHVDCKIIGENGETAAVGAQGELCTKGYSVMAGYWGDPEKTAEAVQDGWMHTGDLAVIDADGYCRITGRVKDMIIRGGENVYPREIEEFLLTHPQVRDVQVFGVPDEILGEEVCAFVIVRDTVAVSEDDIRAFCKDRISHFKIPRYVRLVDEVPMTVSGKPQKFKMRDMMVEYLGRSTS